MEMPTVGMIICISIYNASAISFGLKGADYLLLWICRINIHLPMLLLSLNLDVHKAAWTDGGIKIKHYALRTDKFMMNLQPINSCASKLCVDLLGDWFMVDK